MRIDEFSNAGDIDGSISVAEQTQFLLFGFDIELDEPTASASFFEQIAFNSLITKTINFDSLITNVIAFDSEVTKTASFDSLITTEINFDSPLEN